MDTWPGDNSVEKKKERDKSGVLLTLGGVNLSQRDGAQADGEEFPQGAGHRGYRVWMVSGGLRWGGLGPGRAGPGRGGVGCVGWVG